MNMTPFIDMVFLLIIFFMCVSQMDATQNETLDLPGVSAAEVSRIPLAERMVVNVQTDGTVVVAGHPFAPESLAALFTAARARLGDRLTVVVRADRTVPFEAIREVMRQAADVGIARLSFAVLEEAAP